MAAVIGNREISLGVMGGTLITAACYSGGNVFGCSPYDAATTAYLKATYPSYWQEIREFGFSHKSLIPFINEDNDLIVSLVEVGKERWLKNNGSAFIDLGVIPNQTFDFELSYISHRTTDSGIIGAQQSWTSNCCWIADYGTTLYCFYNSSAKTVSTQINKKRIISANKDYFDVDGNRQALNGTINGIRTNINIFKAGGKACNGDISYVIIRGDYKFNLVPCKNPNGSDYGMLDLVNLQWYGNANTSGAFTIELTDTPT